MRHRFKWLFSLLPALLLAILLISAPAQAAQNNIPPFKTPKPTETPFPTSTVGPSPTPQPTFTPVLETATPTSQPSITPTPVVFPSLTPTPIPTVGSSPYTIPVSRIRVTVDGNCGSFEYFDAYKGNFIDGNNTTGIIYLKHDQNYLYICMIGAQGSYASRFAAVYIDPDGKGEASPTTDELSLRIGIADGVMTTLRGGTPGPYYSASIQGWTAAVQTGSALSASITPYDMAEFKIPLVYATQCGNASPYLAVYHTWFSGTSNDYGWPVSQYWNVPNTWAKVQISGGTNPVSCTFLPMVDR